MDKTHFHWPLLFETIAHHFVLFVHNKCVHGYAILNHVHSIKRTRMQRKTGIHEALLFCGTYQKVPLYICMFMYLFLVGGGVGWDGRGWVFEVWGRKAVDWYECASHVQDCDKHLNFSALQQIMYKCDTHLKFSALQQIMYKCDKHLKFSALQQIMCKCDKHLKFSALQQITYKCDKHLKLSALQQIMCKCDKRLKFSTLQQIMYKCDKHLSLVHCNRFCTNVINI